MEIKSKIRRQYYVNIILNQIPDIIFCGVTAFFIADRGWIMPSFFFIFILQVFYIVLWIKNSIWAWVLFCLLGGRKNYAQSTYEQMKTYNFPEPQNIIDSSANYLEHIIENESLSINVRLEANSMLTINNYLNWTNQFQAFLRWSLVLEDAMELYKLDFKNKITKGTQHNSLAEWESEEDEKAYNDL